MSGASAVASARRRRADPLPQTIQQPMASSSSSNQQIKSVDDSDSGTKQVSTPLQILQQHDKKIKEFEENLEVTIVEISKKVLSENLKHLNLDKPPEVREFDNSQLFIKYDELLSQFYELKTLVHSNLNKSTPQVKEFDSTPLFIKYDELLSQFYELKTLVNSNLDKSTPEVKEFDSTSFILKFDELSSQFNELKTLVIKSFQSNNESSIEMLKIKDKVLDLEQNFLQLELKVKQSSLDEDNMFKMDDNSSAEMLLRSMIESSLMESNPMETTECEKLNIHDTESDNELNDIGDVSEITLTESDLDSIKTEVKEVILVEENVKPDDQILDNKIEISEDEEEILNKNDVDVKPLEEVEREE